MNNERSFALFREPDNPSSDTAESQNRSARGKEPKITAALTTLEEARIPFMSQPAADRNLRKLSRIHSVAASLMCDITQMRAAADTDTDPAEMLRRSARMPTRESSR